MRVEREPEGARLPDIPKGGRVLRRFLAALLVIVLALGVAGCGAEQKAEPPKTKEPAPPAKKGPIVGIVTSTVAQNEEEYRAGEKMSKKYGELVKHVTYPDNFSKEQETTITQILGVASEPTVKAVIICQAVPGSVAAVKKVREKRPDVKFILVVPHEDPKLVNQYADLAMETDTIKRGETIIELAKKMGATKFLHYSFPRHMSMPLLAERKDVMEKKCKELGLQFIFVTAPDPLSDAGLPGAQKFILEDVPRQVKQFGKNIAVFSTNCGMQEPLIRAALQAGCIFPEQCCPSPTHGYPGALGIKITPDVAGNIPKIVDLIRAEIAVKGGKGRFATWPAPMTMVMLEASVELAMDHANGKVNLDDGQAIKAKLESIGNLKLKMRKYDEKTGNFWFMVADSMIF